MSTVRKHSWQGDAILECLKTTKIHPTANWVFQQLKPSMPTLSLGTVYRNLNTLRQAGLIRRVATVDGFDRFDADMSEHSHFICTCCHAVIDVELPEIPESVRTIVKNAVPSDRFAVEILLTGVCRTCSQQEVSFCKEFF